jgi:hypothetical protein
MHPLFACANNDADAKIFSDGPRLPAVSIAHAEPNHPPFEENIVMAILKKIVLAAGAAIGLAVSLSTAAGPTPLSCPVLRSQCDAGNHASCALGYQHCPGFDINDEP